MKRIILILAFIVVSLLISSSACEEIINPKDDDILVEKTLQPATTEQVVNYGTDITITIPSGTLTRETKFTIKKGENLPAMTLEKMNAGSNAFKVIVSGQQIFSSPVVITINYDESKIPSGQTIDQTVKGLIYKNGVWSIANYTLDKINKKIRIYVTDFKSKIEKSNNPILLDEESTTIFMPGYSQGDQGTGDLTIKTMKTIIIYFNHGYPNDRSYWNNYPDPYKAYQSNAKAEIIWSGDNFTCVIDSHPGNVDTSFGQSFMYIHTKFNMSGSIKANDQCVLASFVISLFKIFEDTAAWFSTTEFTTSARDIPLIYQNQTKDTLIYELTMPSTNQNLLSFDFKYWYADGMGEPSTSNVGKSNLVKFGVKFTKN